MDGFESLTSESTESTETTESTSTESGSLEEASQSQTSDDQSQVSQETQQPPQYQPDFSYQVKGIRKEFDEKIRSLITSKDVEDHLRDLYTARDGLDEIKSARELAEQRAQEFHGMYSQAEKNFKRYWALREHSLGEFFKASQISDEQVLDYVRRKFDPEFKEHPLAQEVDRYSQQALHGRFQQEDLQEKLSSYEQQLSATMARLHEMELRSEMQRPEIKGFADRWNSMNPANPFEKVISAYRDMARVQGREVSPSEAIQAVMMSYAPFFQQYQQQSPVVPQAQPNTPKPPVNLGSGSQTATINKTFESLDDIADYRHSLTGR